MTELEQPLWTIAKHQFALPEKDRVAKFSKTSLYEFRVALKLLAQGLEQSKWILGDQFSAADILMGHNLHWAQENAIKLKNARLDDYYLNLSQRPAFKEAISIA
jgi:glutathione S-transferase